MGKLFSLLYISLSLSYFMVKKRFGPRKRMHGLPKASQAKVNFLSIPKEVETTFNTGWGPGGIKVDGGGTKWEIEIELLEHPTQEPGNMVWQTTAEVIRKDIMALDWEDASICADWARKKHWVIETDEVGIVNLVSG